MASLAALPVIAGAEEAAPTPDKGDTASMMVCTRLFNRMAVPGLAPFFGGMVRAKNMLSVSMQVFVIFSLLTVPWVICAYSIAFAELTKFSAVLAFAVLWFTLTYVPIARAPVSRSAGLCATPARVDAAVSPGRAALSRVP